MRYVPRKTVVPTVNALVVSFAMQWSLNYSFDQTEGWPVDRTIYLALCPIPLRAGLLFLFMPTITLFLLSRWNIYYLEKLKKLDASHCDGLKSVRWSSKSHCHYIFRDRAFKLVTKDDISHKCGALSQYDWCPFKRKEWQEWQKRTPCEDKREKRSMWQRRMQKLECGIYRSRKTKNV